MATNSLSDLVFPATVASIKDAHVAINALRAASPILEELRKEFRSREPQAHAVVVEFLAGLKPDRDAVEQAVIDLLKANAERSDASVKFIRATRATRAALVHWMVSVGHKSIETAEARASITEKDGNPVLYLGAKKKERKK